MAHSNADPLSLDQIQHLAKPRSVCAMALMSLLLAHMSTELVARILVMELFGIALPREILSAMAKSNLDMAIVGLHTRR